MEHIIQFGVTIDEQKIIDHATHSASEKIYNRVSKEINNYTNSWCETRLEQMFKKEIKIVIDLHKEEIIENATKLLAANMVKTKAVKEMIQKMEEGDV